MQRRPKIGIIISTTRPGRFADIPTNWLFNIAKERNDADFEIVDLRDYPMPFFEEKVPLHVAPPLNEVALRWGEKVASLVWGLSRSFGRATHLFSFLSFFVRSQSRFFVPIRALLGPARGEAVKVGRRTDLSAYSILARPYLDSFEHDGTLGAIGMTIGGEPACGTRIIAPQPCIR